MKSWFAATAAGIFVVLAPMPDSAQEGGMLYGPIKVIPGIGTVARPSSSIGTPGAFHTHLQILIPERQVTAPPRPGVTVPEANSSGQTPASLACVYILPPYVSQSNGCDPYSVSTIASGGSQNNPIVIVDAYNNPTVVSDLKAFSSYFGLPTPNLTVYYCNQSSCGSTVTAPPRNNAGWALEEALDVQAAHSAAPSAPIILVEANSSSFADLFNAEKYAASLAANGGVVSNSWGSDEFSGQTSYDSIFNKSGVIFFASAGDSPGVEYPSSSPYVVAVGGTTLVLSGSYQLQYQATWAANRSEAGGGGISAYEGVPSYQTSLATQLGFSGRAVPDISADANPVSGLWVYCSPKTCELGSSAWVQVGGTSLSSPLMAAMTASKANLNASSSSWALLTQIYSSLGPTNPNYYQITKPDPENSKGYYCYNGPEDAAVTTLTSNWNVCIGVGTPQGLAGL